MVGMIEGLFVRAVGLAASLAVAFIALAALFSTP